jgi:hypothetical protein
MKKASLIVLYGLFMVFSLFLSWGIVLAQVDPNNPQGQNSPAYWDTEIWINFWDGCLTGMWKWCFDYEKMIWIDKSQNQNITTKSIAQDVLLAATYMVWTVLTVVIIYCWLMYIFAAKDWKDPKAYKDWLVKAGIWAILVRWAYTIVRLIQYIAKW